MIGDEVEEMFVHNLIGAQKLVALLDALDQKVLTRTANAHVRHRVPAKTFVIHYSNQGNILFHQNPLRRFQNDSTASALQLKQSFTSLICRTVELQYSIINHK